MIDSLVICYKHKWIIDRIYKESEKLHRSLIDSTKFEDRCIKQVAKYLMKGEENHLHKRYISKIIRREVSLSLSKYLKEEAELFSSLTDTDEDGDKEIEFEPIDVLGNVESEVIAKEMTVFLGKDGRRKEILKAWSIGNTNDKLISSTLGRTLGGNPESHRKFIQRFKTECQERLATVS